MYIRQKILLSMIENAKEPVSRIQLVKWAFLFAHETRFPQLKHFYKFVPYKYGPFSFNLYYDLDNLVNYGYVSCLPKHKLVRTENVDASPLNFDLEYEINLFLKKYQKYTNATLTKNVYTKYPWFTVNAENPKDRLQRRPIAKMAIYTVGYEGLQIDEFLSVLLKAGIKQVIDVRNNPVSRRYGFHRSSLSKICKKLDIKYKHLPELGIPSKWREALKNFRAYEELLHRYELEILTTKNEAVKIALELITNTPSVVTCMEANPDYCHRSRLAKQLQKYSTLTLKELRG